MEEIAKIKQDAERARTELAILYEISNAMRTTLKLDEILYIILTGVTAHTGLGFNRAILLLVNESDGFIEGKMGIGPENGEEANLIWRNIEHQQMDLDDLIHAYKGSGSAFASGFNRQVQHLKIPLNKQSGGLLASSVSEGTTLHLDKDTMRDYSADTIVQLLKTEELVIVPLKAKDKVNGLILADNLITKKPINNDDIRMLIMLANQAGLAIENSQLYENTLIKSNTDALTNLWNHGYFQHLLCTELERARAGSTNLSLMMLDIDDFKIYNDKLGHQAGDIILKELSTLIKNHSRKMDFVCRYGGEEFAIILPQTDKKETFVIAERIRQYIENYRFTRADILPHKRLTISIGLASFPKDGASPSELIFYSDKALYEAKYKGKNHTCCEVGLS